MSTVESPTFRKKPLNATEYILLEFEIQPFNNPIRAALLGGSPSHKIAPIGASIAADAIKASTISTETVAKLRQESGVVVSKIREREKQVANLLRNTGQRFTLGAMKGYCFADADLEKIVALLLGD
jgi:hypothetical protein